MLQLRRYNIFGPIAAGEDGRAGATGRRCAGGAAWAVTDQVAFFTGD
jgi:hypothetical protein